MSLDKRYQSKIPADSVVLLRMPGQDRSYRRAAAAQAQGAGDNRFFLEIDTTIHGRCFETRLCNPLEEVVEDHATLKASYRLFCGEEDMACGGMFVVFAKPLWRRAVDWFIEFALMDVGIIYIELGCVVVTVIAGLALLIIFVRRRRCEASKTKWVRALGSARFRRNIPITRNIKRRPLLR